LSTVFSYKAEARNILLKLAVAEEVPHILNGMKNKLWNNEYNQVGIGSCDHKLLGSMTVFNYANVEDQGVEEQIMNEEAEIKEEP
jgi:hypothetical protein